MTTFDAIAVIDKPLGITSHDVVAKLRKSLNTKKIGHAGTLDPQASGVLVLGINRGTRFMQYFVADSKKYESIIRLGVATDSDDHDGTITFTKDNQLTRSEIEAALSAFRGPIMQKPSSVSAIKVNGRRAHDLVRAGEVVDLPARPVTVHELIMLDLEHINIDGLQVTDITVHVHCSSGTYVRAIARDLGTALGVGGSVFTLRRTQAGGFDLSDASDLEDVAQMKFHKLGDIAVRILPTHEINDGFVKDIAHGRAIQIQAPEGDKLALLDTAGRLVAIGKQDAGVFQPDNVFLTRDDLSA